VTGAIWFVVVGALLVGMDVLGVIDTLIIDYKRGELQIKPRGG